MIRIVLLALALGCGGPGIIPMEELVPAPAAAPEPETYYDTLDPVEEVDEIVTVPHDAPRVWLDDCECVCKP